MQKRFNAIAVPGGLDPGPIAGMGAQGPQIYCARLKLSDGPFTKITVGIEMYMNFELKYKNKSLNTPANINLLQPRSYQEIQVMSPTGELLGSSIMYFKPWNVLALPNLGEQVIRKNTASYPPIMAKPVAEIKTTTDIVNIEQYLLDPQDYVPDPNNMSSYAPLNVRLPILFPAIFNANVDSSSVVYSLDAQPSAYVNVTFHD
jgi:hypothetical protein